MKKRFKPVAMLEDYIAQTLHLEKKGRKLLSVIFALSGVTLVVSILQVLTLLVCGLPVHFFWRATLPWLPIFGWALWRFFFRYLDQKAFVCDHCGRLKGPKKLSPSCVGRIARICLQCEQRHSKFVESIDNVSRELEILRQGMELVTRFPDHHK